MSEDTKLVNARKDEYDEYVGRGKSGKNILTADIRERGWLGNPFKLKSQGGEYTREESLEKFREVFEEKLKDEEFREAVKDLKGKKLGRWCSPDEDCHGDIIVKWIERNA